MTGLSLGVFDDLYAGRVYDGVKADVGRFARQLEHDQHLPEVIRAQGVGKVCPGGSFLYDDQLILRLRVAIHMAGQATRLYANWTHQ